MITTDEYLMIINTEKARSRLIKVQALETSKGIKLGDRVQTLPFKQIDGNLFPIVTGTVTAIDYVCDFHIDYYRLHVQCDPGQEIRTLEATENCFVKIPAKRFYIQYGIGRAKYLVNHYDGNKKHADGSEFWDLAIFKNKKQLANYVTALQNDGYREKSALA